MKTEKTLIEAQEICLSAAKEVFNFLEIAFTKMEQEGIFNDEPTLTLEPYNNGYQIKIQAFVNYMDETGTNYRSDIKLPSYFNNIHIQPNAFFADYLKEERNARLEYSHFFRTEASSYTHGQADVETMGQFQKFATAWVAIIKKEIDSL